MGRIAAMSSVKTATAVRRAVQQGQATWRQAFGATDKESPAVNQYPRVRPVAGGSWTRSAISEPAATKRLIEALRSMAPGGWSDDRYEQTRQYRGVPYVATERLAKMLSQAEFAVYRKDRTSPDGKKAITEEDPGAPGPYSANGWDLVKLLERPNNQDSFGMIMWRWKQQLNLTGTSLTYMVPNLLGRPFEMYCIPTAIAVPQPAINPDYPDGYYRIQPIYPYGPFSSYPTPASAVGAPIPAQWMLRFQYPHPLLRYEGFSPATGLNLEIDEFNMIGRSRHYSMRRQIRPSAVLNFANAEGAQPLPQAEVERIRAEYEADHQGPENAGRLYVATPGAELQEFGTTAKDMDYPTGWEQLLNFILGGGYGITKPAAGMVEDSSYSTLFATLKQVNLITLDPDCNLIAQYLTMHLAPFFGDDLVIEVRCKRIDDHEITFQKVDKVASFKGLPESVIKYLMRMLDVPIDAEVVAELSKAGQEQQGMMPGMGGPPGADMGAAPGAPDQAGGWDQADQQPVEQAGEEAAVEGIDQSLEEPDFEPLSPEAPTTEEKPVEASAEPPEVSETRPRAGKLSEGALGPRKSLSDRWRRRRDAARRSTGLVGHKSLPASIISRLSEAMPNGTAH